MVPPQRADRPAVPLARITTRPTLDLTGGQNGRRQAHELGSVRPGSTVTVVVDRGPTEVESGTADFLAQHAVNGALHLEFHGDAVVVDEWATLLRDIVAARVLERGTL